MSWRVSMLPLGAMLMVSSAASANLKEIGPGHYTCDAPAGMFGEQEIPALQTRKPVTVSIKIISEHPSTKYTTVGAVYFDTPRGPMRVLVGRAKNEPTHIYVDVWHGNNGDGDVIDQFPVTTDWIPVTLTLDYDGFVAVTSRGRTNQVNFGTPYPVKTKLHCQSGAIEFQVTPPPEGK